MITRYRAKPIVLDRPCYMLQKEVEVWGLRWWVAMRYRGNHIVGTWEKIDEYIRHLEGGNRW